MTKITIFIVFTSIICDAFCYVPKSVHDRVKRWGKGGDMGTGDMSNMFRGTAGVDYPDFKSIPNTSFRCENQELYEGGLYADVEARCQVYHVCHEGRKDSFLCGKGTIFNQQILACDYWYSAECDNAPSYYHLNSQIGNSVSSDTNNQNYPNGNQQNRPNGNQQNYSSENQQNYPSGNQPNYPSNQPNYPSGNQPNYPSGNQPNYPSGNQPNYPRENQPNYPSGNQPNYPSGNQPNYPSGNQPNYPRGNQPNYPSGNQKNYPSGNQPNYPSGNQQISERTDDTDNRRHVPNTDSYNGHNDQPCQCIKRNNVRPWSFPLSMMHGTDR